MSPTTIHPMTLGEVAQHLGVPTWKVQATLERGHFNEWFRVGSYRVIHPDRLPALKDAMTRAGYLPGTEPPTIEASGDTGHAG